VPTISFIHIAVGLPSSLVAFGRESAEAAASQSINSSYIDSTIRPTLSGNSCMYSLGRGIGLGVPQVSLDVLHRSRTTFSRVQQPSPAGAIYPFSFLNFCGGTSVFRHFTPRVSAPSIGESFLLCDEILQSCLPYTEAFQLGQGHRRNG